MPDVIGLAAFGLGDACTGSKKVVGNPVFLPSSVILPRSFLGVFLAGETAAASRLESGFMWPPDAVVPESAALRRVPVAFLWSRLVQDGDRSSYWTPGKGVARFSTAAVLHAHFADLIEKAGWDGEDLVVAIPDTLDEMGQEDLLRSFGSARGRVQLVWRPVAAAMQWLHALGPDFSIAPNDWMLVVYLGPDLFEVTSFALMHDKETGYPMPVRSRGRKGSGLTGMDWAWSCCSGDTVGEKWQQVMRFPEVWESLKMCCGTQGSRHVWSRQDGSWDLWKPERDLHPWQNVRAEESLWISTQLGRRDTQKFPSWNAMLIAAIEDECRRNQRKGRPRGVVMCGPLVPQKRPICFDDRSCAGSMQISRVPEPDTIWLPSLETADIIAEGAKLYGERLRDKLPTYVDTLPWLRIMTQDRRKHLVWKDLVASSVCEGGHVYENEVKGFSYLRRHSSLTALLAKENESLYRQEVVPFPFVPPKDIPIVMHVRMKPASGLAQVKLVADKNVVEDLLFDFSRMKEIDTLPKEELFCPDDGHIRLSEVMDRNKEWAFKADCTDFVNAPPSITSVYEIYDKLRRNWLMPSKSLKLIDENGNTIWGLKGEFIQVAGQLVRIRNNVDQLYSKFARLSSFLWGGMPKEFRQEIAGRLICALKKTPCGDVDKEFIEAAGRSFSTMEECRLLLVYIVRRQLQYAYALIAAFYVLHYRPEACNALDDDTAYGLLKLALVMMEAQRNDKKVKFRNAASLIFVLLKYRLQNGHNNFLGKDDSRAADLQVRETLQKYVEEINEELGDSSHRRFLAVKTQKNLEISRQYLEDILKYIDYKGDPSAVPIMSDEDDG